MANYSEFASLGCVSYTIPTKESKKNLYQQNVTLLGTDLIVKVQVREINLCAVCGGVLKTLG